MALAALALRGVLVGVAEEAQGGVNLLRLATREVAVLVELGIRAPETTPLADTATALRRSGSEALVISSSVDLSDEVLAHLTRMALAEQEQHEQQAGRQSMPRKRPKWKEAGDAQRVGHHEGRTGLR